jgi:hypothetical protein
MVALDHDFLECAVHALDLALGLGMADLGQAVLNLVFTAHPVKHVLESMGILLTVGELDAIVGQHGMDPVRHGCDQIPQELHASIFPQPSSNST